MLLLLLLLLQLVLFMFVQGAIALWAIVYAFELENCLTTFFGARVVINRFKVLGIFETAHGILNALNGCSGVRNCGMVVNVLEYMDEGE